MPYNVDGNYAPPEVKVLDFPLEQSVAEQDFVMLVMPSGQHYRVNLLTLISGIVNPNVIDITTFNKIIGVNLEMNKAALRAYTGPTFQIISVIDAGDESLAVYLPSDITTADNADIPSAPIKYIKDGNNRRYRLMSLMGIIKEYLAGIRPDSL